MATKKQKRAAAAAKREAFMESVRKSGLAELEASRESRAIRRKLESDHDAGSHRDAKARGCAGCAEESDGSAD